MVAGRSTRESIRQKIMPTLPWNLVIYDGKCYWCNAKAHWMHDRNFLHDVPEKRLFYAQFQSPEARYIQSHFPQLRPYYKSSETTGDTVSSSTPNDGGTLVLFEKVEARGSSTSLSGEPQYDCRISVKSDAILRILSKCEGMAISNFAVFLLYAIPRAIRDLYFDYFWSRREKRFGFAPTSLPLTPELKARRWKMPKG